MCEVEGGIEKGDHGEELIVPGQLQYQSFARGGAETDGKAVESFRSWAGLNDDEERYYYQNTVYCIGQTFAGGKYLELSVREWNPFACQGGGGGCRSHPFCVSFAKGSKFIGYSQDIFWSRSPTFVPKADLFKLEPAVKSPIPLATFKKQSLKEAFDVVLPVGLKNPLVISRMKDEIAYEVLYSKLLHHPTITKIDFPTAKYCKGTMVNFCCNLIRNSHTLEELHFQDIGSLNENMVQTLFESVKITRNLKVLNLRTSRYLETWNKASPGGRSNKPSIQAEHVLAGLQSMECSQCPLETLDFGGNTILSSSSASIVELVTILLSPSFGLKRLSFRGCNLTEEGLLVVATELENHDCLEYLDLSHNTITKPVMERLANSLVKNQSLRELKLEHSSIDLEMVECLASSLPQIQRLQHLYLDGNEFTWEPLTEEKEAIGTIAMVRGLEKNESLLSLKMGEFGKLAPWGMSCCQSPPYNTTLQKDNRMQLEVCLEMNKILLEELKWSRSQQAVVKIAEILLGKLAGEAE